MSDTGTKGGARRPRRASAVTTPDPIELAMEAAATGGASADVVQALLENQNRLIGWQVATERAAFALKFLTAVVGVVAAVVVAAVLISASHYRGLTIQPFSVPPELEARGLNGSAVATRVLDKLTALQAGTVSLRAPNSYANSWGDSVEVEIPQMGVSAGELWKFLRSWLGEEVKITGEIVRLDAGLQITARAGGQAAPPLVGTEAELEALLDRAAEAIFAETQPYRYAVYLGRNDRLDEAMAAFERLAMTGDETDRKWALAGWSLYLQLTNLEASIAKAQAALRIDPDFGLARANLSGVLGQMGRVEEAYQQQRLSVRSLRNDDDLNSEFAEGFIVELEGRTFSMAHDHTSAAAKYEAASAYDGRSERGAALEYGFQLAQLHEFDRGRAIVAAMPPETGGEGPTRLQYYENYACWLREDWACFAASMDAVLAAPDASNAIMRRLWLAQSAPDIAYGRARIGDLAGAEALIAQTPSNSYLAVTARGMIAALKGDVAASERWFAEAVRLAPSFADAHQAWGRARLERGDRAGAVVQLAQAAAKAPQWADPLKYQGDALLMGGDARGAVRKYAVAAKRAPRWGGLHLAWGRALEAQGRRDEAGVKYQAALGMDLSAAEMADCRRRLADNT